MSEDPQRRAKIEAFYKKYAPTEMAKVENAVKAKVPEAELFKMLREKYKVTDTTGIAFGDLSPSTSSANFGAASASSSHFGTGGDAGKRSRIEAFYKKYAPGEMAKVENAMKAKIAEGELFKMLRERYKVTDTTGVANGEPEEENDSANNTGSAGATGATSLRDKVTAFFQKHAPQDIGKVEKTLSFNLPEDELFARLRQKYGITEDTASASASATTPPPASASTSGGETYKDRVLAWLEKHAPQDTKKIDKIMGFNLPEDELMARLRQKYGITEDAAGAAKSTSPTPSGATSTSVDSTAAGTTTRDKVKAFLEKHAPNDIGRLDKLLSKGLSEEDLMAALRNKYGVTDTGDGATAGAASPRSRTNSLPPSEASSAEGSFREKVKSFLEKHAPQDIGRLDKLLAKGLSEEDLMKALRAKYNVSDADAGNSGGDGGGDLKERVTAFFQKHAPNDIHRVDKAVALGAQVGEAELFVKLRQKYNVSEDSNNNNSRPTSPSPTAGSGGDSSALKEKVTTWFKKHAPNDVHRVDKAVALAGQVGEAELFEKLRAKYNVSVEQEAASSTTSTSKPKTPSSSDLSSPVTQQEPEQQQQQQTKDRSIVDSTFTSPAASTTVAPATTIPTPPPAVVTPPTPQPVVTATEETQQQQPKELPKSTTPVVSTEKPTSTPKQPQLQPQEKPVVQQQQQQQQQQQTAPPPTVQVQVPQFTTPASVTTFVSKFMESQNHKIEELLFSLQQREDAIANRERAIEAREVAFDSRCLSLGAEPTRVVFDAAGQQTAEFVSHMVDVESTLAAATADLIRFEKALREQEQEIADKQLHLEKKEKLALRDEEERKERLAQREKEIQKQNQHVMEMQASQEADRKRLLEISRQNAEKESDLAAREARLGAQMDALRQREAALEIQQEATTKEREASRKFSEELLQREGTVRAVERSLNAARAELTRLENDVSLHAKKLLEDQRALRRWSEELERREERFQRKNPNAASTGIRN